MSSSDVSSSPPASPSSAAAAAAAVPPEPTLQQLVRHFVAAKRALTSTTYGWRANELVTTSRALIEEIAILNAKNLFARHTIQSHVDTLQHIRDGIADAGKNVTDEFKKTIADLDHANARLQDTLTSLKQTVLHPSLLRSEPGRELDRSQGQRDDEDDLLSGDPDSKSPGQSNTVPKTLHDFILETDHEDILASLRALIDSFQEAHGEFDDGLATFDQTRASIISDLSQHNAASPVLHASSAIDPSPSTRTLYTSLETHATSMATLLQSLIAHYDLCVSALKHTEGGGHAAFLAAQAAHLTRSRSPSPGHGGGGGGAEESLYRKTVPEPISRLERAEMLTIVASDAEEVDDVVSELQDRSAAMEATHGRLHAHATHARATHRRLRAAAATLRHLHAAALPRHLAGLRAFTAAWKSLHDDMARQTAALVALTEFHARFRDAYAQLLLEIQRRVGAEARMRKVADKAARELARLWEADGEARDAFVEDAGRYLPGDLYPAIGSGARRWVITREGVEEARDRREGDGREGDFG